MPSTLLASFLNPPVQGGREGRVESQGGYWDAPSLLLCLLELLLAFSQAVSPGFFPHLGSLNASFRDLHFFI